MQGIGQPGGDFNELQSLLAERLRDPAQFGNETTFGLLRDSFLPNVPASFRRALDTSLTRKFNTFQGTRGKDSFLDSLGSGTSGFGGLFPGISGGF